jgi:hypothetical protein
MKILVDLLVRPAVDDQAQRVDLVLRQKGRLKSDLIALTLTDPALVV